MGRSRSRVAAGAQGQVILAAPKLELGLAGAVGHSRGLGGEREMTDQTPDVITGAMLQRRFCACDEKDDVHCQVSSYMV